MLRFYVGAWQYGNRIFYRGIENGRKVTLKDSFSPSLFVRAKKHSDWVSLYGDPLAEVSFTDINEAKDYVKQYEGVEGFELHGMTQFQYQYINQHFPDEVQYDTKQMNIQSLDIECASELGFPNIETANEEILLIALTDRTSRKSVVFGSRSYTPTADSDIQFEYKLFKDEYSMLRGFVEYWQANYPEIVTGWSIDVFDFPYLVNRIARVMDDDWVKKLSPFGVIQERKVEIRGKEVQTYEILGVTQLDYLTLYKKFTYTSQESYSLDNISSIELGEKKVENPYATFKDFYSKDWNRFVEYNCKDTVLPLKLDDKMQLIDLVISIAYQAKCNIRDVFGPVKTWDVYIYNYLSKQKIAIPPQSKRSSREFEGAYVKDPIPGMYGWVVSFDFASLYPNIIRQWNMSPETITSTIVDMNVDKMVDMNEYPRDGEVSVAANGSTYSIGKEGILPKLMSEMLDGRKGAKKEMLRLEDEFQKTKNNDLVPKISALNNKQMALKILANSAYGAVSNAGFRYYDIRIAEAITLTGQASDKFLERELNIFLNKALKTEDVSYAIYLDTDSVYLNLQSLVDKHCAGKNIKETTAFLDKFCEDVLQKVVQKSVDKMFSYCNCRTKTMNAKREAIASKGLWVSKKRYALLVHNSEGVEYDPPKLKIMGLDIVRSSTPHTIRAILKDSLKLMFEKSEKDLQKHITEVRGKFMQMPPEDIAFPRGVTDLEKWSLGSGRYKSGTPIHVRGSILYNSHYANKDIPPIANSDKIRFIYLKLPNPIKEDVLAVPAGISFPDAIKGYIDYDTQFEKTFLKPLEGLAVAAKWKLEEQSSLEDFFG